MHFVQYYWRHVWTSQSPAAAVLICWCTPCCVTCTHVDPPQTFVKTNENVFFGSTKLSETPSRQSSYVHLNNMYADCKTKFLRMHTTDFEITDAHEIRILHVLFLSSQLEGLAFVSWVRTRALLESWNARNVIETWWDVYDDFVRAICRLGKARHQVDKTRSISNIFRLTIRIHTRSSFVKTGRQHIMRCKHLVNNL